MPAIRIRKMIESDTVTLPELKPFIGNMVEIAIEVSYTEETRKEFWDVFSKLPSNEEEFDQMHETFRMWRTDPRFQVYWPTLGHALETKYKDFRQKVDAIDETWGLLDYDYQAQFDQDACDIKDQKDRHG